VTAAAPAAGAVERLPRVSLLIYAAPAAAASLQTLPLQAYITAFWSNEMALPLAIVGLGLSLTRLLDIFTDIGLGLFSDRLRTRWGRRKPLIAAGLPLAVLAVWMLFVPPEGAGVAYFLFWVIAFNVLISTVEVPYAAWGAELSTDYDERTRVTAWRTVAGQIGSFVALSIPLALQQLGFESTRSTLMGMAVAYAVLQPLLLLPLLVRGRDRPARDVARAGPTFGQSVAVLWRSQAFRVLALGLLLFAGGKAVSGALHLIYMTELVQQPQLFPIMLVLEGLTGLAAVPAWMWLARRTAKATAMMAAALWSGLWSLPLFLVGEGDGWLFIGIICLRAVSLTAWVILIPSMTADAVDVDTLAAGRERTGVFFGALSFFTKAALAVGIFVGAALPGLAGFQPSDPVHTEQGLLALKLVYAVGGPLLVVASAFVFWRFPITRERQRALKAEIAAASAAAAAATPATA
jgi:Na+/melibiose symporter-like transporter